MGKKSESESSTAASSEAAEFNLKHRITGAAVLLLLGALVIPWFLGPPSEASRHSAESTSANMSTNGAVGEMENELLAELDQGFEQPEEQVYISKITPLDAQRNQALANAAEQAAKSVDSAADNTEAASDPVTSSSGQNLSTKTEDQAINTSEPTETKDKPKASADNSVPIESAPKTTTKPVEVATADLEQQQRERELKAALAAESQGRQPAVEVGWIVQVGLYLEEKGARSKMSDLGRLGFQPASTIVDTNRGPKTGTRVWLGPFAKRSQAESENKALKQKTGKDGFIRVYP